MNELGELLGQAAEELSPTETLDDLGLARMRALRAPASGAAAHDGVGRRRCRRRRRRDRGLGRT